MIFFAGIKIIGGKEYKHIRKLFLTDSVKIEEIQSFLINDYTYKRYKMY